MSKKVISNIYLIEKETLQNLRKEAKDSGITFKELIEKIDGRRFYFKKECWTRKDCSLFSKERYYYFKKKGYGPVEYINFKNLYSANEN